MSSTPSREEIVALQQTLYASKNPTRRWLHLKRKAWIEAALGASGPGRAALEVGPGSGVYLPTLAEHFESVTASDIAEAHLEHLAPLFPDVTVLRDDITSSALEPGSFDLILCSEVVEPILKQGHINLMTRTTVRAQLEAAGFRVEREHFTGVYLPFVAEFTGGVGLRLAKIIERVLPGTVLQWLLWTQYYVARKPE